MPIRKADDGVESVTNSEGVEITLHDEGLSLGKLAKSKLNKEFPQALKEVAANIVDLEYPPAAPREINIKIKIIPQADRSGAKMSVQLVTKLAAKREKEQEIFFQPVGSNEIAISTEEVEQRGFKFGE